MRKIRKGKFSLFIRSPNVSAPPPSPTAPDPSGWGNGHPSLGVSVAAHWLVGLWQQKWPVRSITLLDKSSKVIYLKLFTNRVVSVGLVKLPTTW